MKFTVIDNQTGEYPDCYNIALNEEWAKGLVYCDISGFLLDEDGDIYVFDDCNNMVMCPPGRFTVVFEDGSDS